MTLDHKDQFFSKRVICIVSLDDESACAAAIIPAAPEHLRNRDTEYLYRPDSYFYYLTGFSEPHASLVVSSEGTSVLFCQPKDLEREVWTGYRLGPDAAVDQLGVDEAYSSEQLATRLPRCRSINCGACP